MQIKDPDFQFLRRLVFDQSSIQLGEEKRDMVCNRLNSRLTTLGLSSVEQYCDLLKSNREPEEITHLIDALSTNVTNFFREIEHFQYLKEKVVPEFLASGSWHSKGPFRAWSAACSTGEEAYSLAIVMATSLEALPHGAWEISASDISTRVLEKAREGIYDAERVKLPNPTFLARFFQKGTEEWEGSLRVKQLLRAQVDFRHENLLDFAGEQGERYHVIFCRNVMIYFNDASAEALVGRLFEQLHEGSYLFIGHAESLVRKPRGLRQVKPSIFRKVSC